MICFAHWAFGKEMCGKALIKIMSVQPQVKCLHLTSIFLAHLCYLPARFVVSHSYVFTVPNQNSLNSGSLCCRWGKTSPTGYYLFFPANKLSAVMFKEAVLGVIINVWDIGECTCV